MALLSRSAALRALWASPRTRRLLSLAAVVISVNWGVFIWGVNNGHVVETSLGYFINPLVTVLAGVVILGERLRPLQWGALGLAAAAVLGLAIENGRPPWVALALAFSFATYGVLKKKANAGAIEGLTVETLVIAPVALGYLLWLGSTGASHATVDLPWHLVLLATSGVVTALPADLLRRRRDPGARSRPWDCCSTSRRRIQFLLGVTLLGEPMSPGRWAGFAVIWVALALFTADSVRQRQLTRLRVEASAV